MIRAANHPYFSSERKHRVVSLWLNCSLTFRFEPLLDNVSRQAGLRPESCWNDCLGKKKINFSTVFAGQAVGIKEVHDDIWLVSFMDYDLGYFDLETRVLEPHRTGYMGNTFGPNGFSSGNPCVRAGPGLEWSGRMDLNHRPPGPEQQNQKIQVLHLVSLRSQKAILSLPQLYRSCTDVNWTETKSTVHTEAENLVLIEFFDATATRGKLSAFHVQPNLSAASTSRLKSSPCGIRSWCCDPNVRNANGIKLFLARMRFWQGQHPAKYMSLEARGIVPLTNAAACLHRKVVPTSKERE